MTNQKHSSYISTWPPIRRSNRGGVAPHEKRRSEKYRVNEVSLPEQINQFAKQTISSTRAHRATSQLVLDSDTCRTLPVLDSSRHCKSERQKNDRGGLLSKPRGGNRSRIDKLERDRRPGLLRGGYMKTGNMKPMTPSKTDQLLRKKDSDSSRVDYRLKFSDLFAQRDQRRSDRRCSEESRSTLNTLLALSDYLPTRDNYGSQGHGEAKIGNVLRSTQCFDSLFQGRAPDRDRDTSKGIKTGHSAPGDGHWNEVDGQVELDKKDSKTPTLDRFLRKIIKDNTREIVKKAEYKKRERQASEFQLTKQRGQSLKERKQEYRKITAENKEKPVRPTSEHIQKSYLRPPSIIETEVPYMRNMVYFNQNARTIGVPMLLDMDKGRVVKDSGQKYIHRRVLELIREAAMFDAAVLNKK